MEGKIQPRSTTMSDPEGNIINDIPQPYTEEEVRKIRNDLLAETDYLALSDHTMTDDIKNYRKALRDISSQAGFPNETVFPTKVIL